MTEDMDWTDWSERLSEDGQRISRTRMGVRIATKDWGRKVLRLRLERLTYHQADGVRRIEAPRIFQSQAGHASGFEIITHGKPRRFVSVGPPGRIRLDDGVEFFGYIELDDGEYTARLEEGATTNWTIGREYITAPLPPYQFTFTIEGSAPQSAKPRPEPSGYDPDDDPYRPSLW
ncbi:hypothetical protein [Streptomyces sp. NPDC048350]|uniref:hypothetical protein n=1 Tax=Streptomyces sp. NPDC048350 TaxID=3365538 RepID=UPI0037197956